MSDTELITRAALPTDLNFIRRTWLSGLHDLPNGLPDEQWWPAYRSYVESKLFSSDNKVLIVGTSDSPHEILGYAVASEKVLEWIHVRKGLRGNGLAGVLLRALGFNRANLTPLSRWRTRLLAPITTKYLPARLRLTESA